MEVLAVDRARLFVTYCLEHDLQVLLNRRNAMQLLNRSLASADDSDSMEWPADSFDKISTFLAQNDQQVHFANASNTVGVYAIIKLLGELRRALRDRPGGVVVHGRATVSPSSAGNSPPGSVDRQQPSSLHFEPGTA